MASALTGALGYIGGRDAHAATDREPVKSDPALLDELHQQSVTLRMQQTVIEELSARVRSMATDSAASPPRAGSLPAHSDVAKAPAPVEPLDPAPVAQAPAPETQVAQEEALAMLDQAVSRRTWQASDRIELNKLLAQLTREQSTEILTKLSTALSTGTVRLEHGQP